jgi:DNA-binding transcriptional MerR regulator
VQPLSGYKLTTKMTQVQQMLNLLDRAPIINQMYGPNAIKTLKLAAYVMEQGFDIRNVDEFVSLPPEDSKLLTAIEEQEMWYHGNVPPRRADDNDMRHALAHQEEIVTERFNELERRDPGTAAAARAHIADHLRKMALLQEQQEKMLMEMQQAANAQGISTGGEGGAGPDGAAEPGQEPGSPKVRADENEPGGEHKEVKSEAMSNAPNGGAQ